MISKEDVTTVADLFENASFDSGPPFSDSLRSIAARLIEIYPRLLEDTEYTDELDILNGATLFMHLCVTTPGHSVNAESPDIDNPSEVVGDVKALMQSTGAEAAILRQLPKEELDRLTVELIETERELRG